MAAQFTSDLWAHGDEPGSWHFVTLPPDVSDDLTELAGPRPGFGSIRVTATLGSTTWQTSLFPDAKRGALVLPVKKTVRAAERLTAGDRCEVTVELAT
jgi:hypothetical protein